MPIKIKKQYKQQDGTLIEVEGTEAEVEAFEKKQQKQKKYNEETQQKKTILYGKDLEDIRNIIREELAKMPKTEYHYHYQSNPYFNPNTIPLVNPNQPTWYGTTSDSVSIGGGVIGTSTPNWSSGPTQVYDVTSTCTSLLDAGSISSKTQEYLMAPRS